MGVSCPGAAVIAVVVGAVVLVSRPAAVTSESRGASALSRCTLLRLALTTALLEDPGKPRVLLALPLVKWFRNLAAEVAYGCPTKQSRVMVLPAATHAFNVGGVAEARIVGSSVAARRFAAHHAGLIVDRVGVAVAMIVLPVALIVGRAVVELSCPVGGRGGHSRSTGFGNL